MSFLQWARRHVVLILVALLVAAWSVFLIYVPSEKIVAAVGVENTYLVAFLLAATAGASTLTSTSFYGSIATFALGGASPLILGLAGGVGAFLSNALFYYLVLYGRKSLTGKLKAWGQRFAKRVEALPPSVVYAAVFCYSGLTPLPDDILIATLAISSYRFLRFAPFLLAGNITIVMLIALFAGGQ